MRNRKNGIHNQKTLDKKWLAIIKPDRELKETQNAINFSGCKQFLVGEFIQKEKKDVINSKYYATMFKVLGPDRMKELRNLNKFFIKQPKL